ncbi:MAG: hypothetical protein ACR2PW_06170 [Gammaproteobacteria bacterium]
MNERAQGWLHFLYQKATTPDDWSKNGEPHPWWDRTSSPPMCAFPRFDLQESAYAIALMCDQTPAWREVYVSILDEIAERFLTHWAAVDWLSQFGPDPARKDYPNEWKGTLIPQAFWGEYDAPGWVANGVEPWGMQPDPIGADGNLFFKGWLNLTQALYTYVSGYDKWAYPFMMTGVGTARFEWTQHQLVDHLYEQWLNTPMGPHCENTKAWPYCLSAAGLGLLMYDNLFEKDAHMAYHQWRDYTEDQYYGFNTQGSLEWVTMYYDAQKNHNHITFPPMGLAIAFYALPQAPLFAEKLYRGAVNFMQWDKEGTEIASLPDPRMLALGLTCAKEMGDYRTEARLRSFAEKHFEPRFFGLNDSQFGYWFNFGENWPRGQLSALAICSEIGEKGAWEKLFQRPNLSKYSAPTVADIQYPEVGVAQAWHDDIEGCLYLELNSGNHTRCGQPTSFSIYNLPDASRVSIQCNGSTFTQFKIKSTDEIEVHTQIDHQKFEIRTHYHSAPNQGKTQIKPYDASGNQRTSARTSRANTMLWTPISHCGCCA